MTETEVIAKYGRPHEKRDSEQRWFYYADRWGCGIGLISVYFDQEGRVTSYWWH